MISKHTLGWRRSYFTNLSQTERTLKGIRPHESDTQKP